MSVPELPYITSSPEDIFQAYLRGLYIKIDKMRLELTKLQERIKTLLNSMIGQHQNFKLQIQPQAVSGSDIFLYKGYFLEGFLLS